MHNKQFWKVIVGTFFSIEMVLKLSYQLFFIAQFTMNNYLALNIFGFKHVH